MMFRAQFRILAWLALSAIVFVTVSPIGLRPHDYLSVDLDRALAFAVMAMLFVLAYPRHVLLISILLVIGAGGIETLQLLSPPRHAHMADAAVKATGAALGASAGWILLLTARRFLAPQAGR